MEEDLQHLDLIDKYINNELSESERIEFERLLIEDKKFGEELKFYKALYSGIEEKSKTELKSRLQGYYEEYEEEQQARSGGGIQRYLAIGLSIAATLIVGFFLIFQPNVSDDNGNNIGNNTEDTTKTDDPEVPALIQDDKDLVTDSENKKQQNPDAKEDRNDQVPNQFLSIGGIKQVPASGILSATYPGRLEYSFNGKDLIIYGDPLISMLRLRVLKIEESYVLSLNSEFYELPLRQDRTALISTTRTYEANESLDEQVNVKIESIKATAQPYGGLSATISGADVPVTYYFDDSKDTLAIVFDGNLDPSKVRLYKIEQPETEQYYLIYEDQLFSLNPDNREATPLRTRSILENNNTRLFRERRPVSKAVTEGN